MDMVFTKETWDTLKAYFGAAYLQLGDLELQGYGKVRMEDGEPVCYEVGIPEQEVSMTKTDATWDQMLAFLQERINFKDTKKAAKEVKDWRLWWHTHGKGVGSPSYSGTDEDTIRALAGETRDHMWGLVFHTDTMASSLYLATHNPVPLYASLGSAACEMTDVDVPDDISNEVALKVSKKQFKPLPTKAGQRGSGTYPTPYAPPYCKHPDGCLCVICEQTRRDDAEQSEEEDFFANLEDLDNPGSSNSAGSTNFPARRDGEHAE